jgi:hypothetical protein
MSWEGHLMRKMLLTTMVAAAGGALAAPAAAPAAGWNCSASALLGQPVGAPVSANVGATTCRTVSAGGNLPALPIPLQANLMSARTALDGPSGPAAQQTPSATGEVASLTVDVPADAPIPVPTTSLPNPLGGAAVDITNALRSLVPAAAGPLAGVKLSSATASGHCSGGAPALTGSSRVLGVTVAGQELPVDQAVTQVIQLTGSLDPSQLRPSALPAPLNQLPASQLQPALDALPAVPFAAPVQVRLVPGSQTRGAGTLTQKGLQIFLAIAGQTVTDLTLGQATISQGDVSCGQAVSAAQLQCTTRKLALIDVLERKGYARLYGAADRRFIGKRVSVVSSWNGKVVARPMVQRDGTFTAKGKLPPLALRHTNRARYQAKIGKERSLRLKLFRRMLVTRMTSAKGKVTIAGRVVLPLGRPVQTITIKRRVSCTKNVVAKTLHPDAHGRFSVTLGAPPSGQAAVYRLATRVRKNTRNPKLYPTFTLPRAVALKQ